jgi:hypothetical protein
LPAGDDLAPFEYFAYSFISIILLPMTLLEAPRKLP